MVLFGGYVDVGTGRARDTWEWDGSTWTLVASTGPEERGDHAMAYDSARGRIVLFSGDTETWPPPNDVWEFASAVHSNTPQGINVAVKPLDAATGTTPVTITFDNVSQPGTTTLTINSTGPLAPAGFQLGTPAMFYDVSTTAVFSGAISICISYSDVAYTNESELRLFHFENGQWVDRTLFLDTVTKIICGQVSSLSPFAIFEKAPHTFIGFLDPINNDGSSVFKLGSTIPIKFQLTNEFGLPVTTAVGRLTFFKITDALLGTVEEVTVDASGSSNTDNIFRYSAPNYIYNLSTKPYTKGTYRIQVTLDDGTVHKVNISLKAK